MAAMLIRAGIACVALASSNAALATSAPEVRCELTLQGDRIQLRADERIELKMAFIAEEPGYIVNTTIFAGPSPSESVQLTPAKTVYPWSADLGRFTHFQNDALTFTELIAQTPVEVPIVLNDDYRFDLPGHYRIMVTSRRVRAARQHGISSLNDDPSTLLLTCNDVSFEVLPAVTADEQARVASIVQRIRAAGDANAAQAIIWKELDYLSGDSATAAKIGFFLNPIVTGDLTTNATRGLWIARNRVMVVAALEKAIVDPAQRNGVSMNLLGTLVALKASLEMPLASPSSQPPPALTRAAIERLTAEYVHQIAQTIPKRNGEAAIDAARTVFVWMASTHTAVGPEFDTAREYLIAHFAQIEPHTIDWLLGGFGSYLRDRRLIPVLQGMLGDTSDPSSGPNRNAVATQLALIGP